MLSTRADSILIRKKSCTVWDRSTARKKNRTAKNKLIIKFVKILGKIWRQKLISVANKLNAV